MRYRVKELETGKILLDLSLQEKQQRCFDSKAKQLLLSGGFRSGKTLALIIKLIMEHCSVPNNRILIGRLTYPELRDSVQKDFFDLLPREYIKKWNESYGELTLDNNTQILFRHLDAVSEEEIRGMTLGAALLSQIEEIKESVYLAILSRLSLKEGMPSDYKRQLLMDCNPVLFWAYKLFKQEVDSERELIEFSMLDNRENLPEDYIADMLKRPEAWKRQFVYGIWDESLLSDKSVIPIEYIQAQRAFMKEPIRRFEGVDIFEDVNYKHDYQAGIDVSEGVGQDYSALSIMDTITGNQVAFWRGQVPPDLLAQRILPVLNYFNEALAIPEINGIGLAFLTRLKDSYMNIYHRKEYDKAEEVEKESLGWKTTYATKPLLVDNFLKLNREGKIRIRSKEVLSEMASFIYTNEANKRGMGAAEGFHDDSLIAAMISCLDLNPSESKRKEPSPLDRYHIGPAHREDEQNLSILNV